MRFEKALQSLSDAEVEFVVIGGVAAALHGSARATWDVDICFSRATINLRRLAAALAPFHPRLRDLPDSLPFVWDEATLSNGTVFALLTDLGKIDLLAEVAGVVDTKRRGRTPSSPMRSDVESQYWTCPR